MKSHHIEILKTLFEKTHTKNLSKVYQ